MAVNTIKLTLDHTELDRQLSELRGLLPAVLGEKTRSQLNELLTDLVFGELVPAFSAGVQTGFAMAARFGERFNAFVSALRAGEVFLD